MEIKEVKLEEFDEVYEDLVNLEFENEQIHFPNKNLNIEKTKSIIKNIKGYMQENKAYVFVAIEEDNIIGYIWCYPKAYFDENRIYVNALIVKKDYRRKNIGQLLLKKAEERAKELKCDAIYLSAATFNDGAIRFYKRNEYKEERIELVKKIKK